MLKSEAEKKMCPFKMSGSGGMTGSGDSDFECVTSNCMGWTEWHIRVPNSNPVEWVRRDPPEGACGMVQPELNCEH